MRKHRFLLLIVPAALAVPVTLVILFLVFVYPWVRVPGSPQTIEARWAKVEAIASENGGTCAGDVTLLSQALASIEECDAGLAELTQPSEDGTVPALGPGDLPACATDAVASLVAWSESGGGLGTTSCASDIRVLPLLRLSRSALAIADPGSREAGAVLVLAGQLRRCGPLIHRIVGFVMADEAVMWARDRGAVPDGQFVSTRPLREDVLPAVAGEAVCSHDMVRDMAAGQGEIDPMPGIPIPLRVDVFLTRELLVYKHFHSTRILDAAEHPTDLEHVARSLDFDHSDPDSLPRSILLINVAVPLGPQVRRLDEIIDRYDAFLADHHSTSASG